MHTSYSRFLRLKKNLHNENQKRNPKNADPNTSTCSRFIYIYIRTFSWAYTALIKGYHHTTSCILIYMALPISIIIGFKIFNFIRTNARILSPLDGLYKYTCMYIYIIHTHIYIYEYESLLNNEHTWYISIYKFKYNKIQIIIYSGLYLGYIRNTYIYIYVYAYLCIRLYTYIYL